jgi:hypothetical protein
MEKVKTMNDWTEAVLTISKNYYVRQMYKWKSYNRPLKHNETWDRIEYYNLEGNYIPLAMAECKKCWEIIQSQYCWHFVSCSCWHTMVDTDRWMPERHRFLIN